MMNLELSPQRPYTHSPPSSLFKFVEAELENSTINEFYYEIIKSKHTVCLLIAGVYFLKVYYFYLNCLNCLKYFYVKF